MERNGEMTYILINQITLMSTLQYILIGWLAFDALVYAYLFYDMHAKELDIRGRASRLFEAITEEE